jgi:transcriptional regulator with XRE-family HTH domain
MTGRHPFVELRAKMSPKARERVVAKAKRLRREMDLAELRRALELSQQQLAEKLHVNQPEIAKIEKRADMLLSTLGAVLRAMGADLKIIASFSDHDVRIRNLARLTRNRGVGSEPAA